jgi:hypothetical protein
MRHGTLQDAPPITDDGLFASDHFVRGFGAHPCRKRRLALQLLGATICK